MKAIQLLFLISCIYCFSAKTVLQIELPDDPLPVITKDGVYEYVPPLVPHPTHISHEAIHAKILEGIVKHVHTHATTLPYFQGIERFKVQKAFNLLNEMKSRRGKSQQYLSKLQMAPPPPENDRPISLGVKEGGMNIAMGMSMSMGMKEQSMKVSVENIEPTQNVNREQFEKENLSLSQKILMPGVSMALLVACVYMISKYFRKVDKVYKRESYDEETQRMLTGFRNLKD